MKIKKKKEKMKMKKILCFWFGGIGIVMVECIPNFFLLFTILFVFPFRSFPPLRTPPTYS